MAADTYSPPKRGSSRPSVLSRASSFFGTGVGRSSSFAGRKSRSSIFSFASRPSAFEVDLVVAPGDLLETTAVVTVREEENLESLVVAELPMGTTLRVEEMGISDRRRVKVSMPECSGWVSLKTRLGEPLVARTFVADDFEVGGRHEVKSNVTLRTGESLDSVALTELQAGTKVQILELGATSLRRAKVSTDHAEGWLSLCTKNGEYLLGKVDNAKCQYGLRPASSVNAALLEAARSGDLEGFTKLLQGGGSRSSFLGKPAPAKPDPNATDIRGKNALMFAASWGHKRIVEHLLAQPEVDVFRADDTLKQAIHHASRMPRGAPSPEQAAIIEALIKARSNAEARDHRGATPLMIASGGGHEIAAKALLACSANVNTEDEEGHTALDYARKGRQDAVQNLLLQHGSKSGSTNTRVDGETLPIKAEAAVDTELQIDADDLASPHADADEGFADSPTSPQKKKKTKKSVSRPKKDSAEVAKDSAEVASPEKEIAEVASPGLADGELVAGTPLTPGFGDEGESDEGGDGDPDGPAGKDKKPKGKKKTRPTKGVGKKKSKRSAEANGTEVAADDNVEDDGQEDMADDRIEGKIDKVEEKDATPLLTAAA